MFRYDPLSRAIGLQARQRCTTGLRVAPYSFGDLLGYDLLRPLFCGSEHVFGLPHGLGGGGEGPVLEGLLIRGDGVAGRTGSPRSYKPLRRYSLLRGSHPSRGPTPYATPDFSA
jgi:hypothetical protein